MGYHNTINHWKKLKDENERAELLLDLKLIIRKIPNQDLSLGSAISRSVYLLRYI